MNKVVKTENRVINNQQKILKIQTLGLQSIPVETQDQVNAVQENNQLNQ